MDLSSSSLVLSLESTGFSQISLEERLSALKERNGVVKITDLVQPLSIRVRKLRPEVLSSFSWRSSVWGIERRVGLEPGESGTVLAFLSLSFLSCKFGLLIPAWF